VFSLRGDYRLWTRLPVEHKLHVLLITVTQGPALCTDSYISLDTERPTIPTLVWIQSVAQFLH